ncbi:MAG TPA: Ppx/GppA phosphatase family protein [Propionibacteriaceae bacterium]|jgi:exopolyphosphatase/guanosine-5'-triphosphate,3'-diphosphate pyrophosphatase
MRVAVIDCGTNTIRLLVADPGRGMGLSEVDRRLELVRLGQGVDATRRFHPDALARTFAAVDTYAARIRELGVDQVRFLATSAARDVSNRDEFFDGVRDRLGVDVDVITGDEEARLSFLGALSGGPVSAGPVLVMDVGGGSTELILGDLDGSVRVARSLDMGSVRIRERFLAGDPPTAAEVGAARAFVDQLLDSSGIPMAEAATWIGVAGTTTSLSAVSQGLTAYDRTRVHNSIVAVDEITRLSEQLLATPVDEVLAAYPMLQRLRAEVICAGALIVEQVAARVGEPMTVRETDILDGATLELLRR